MKPHTILHMMSSIDGRIVVTHWPKDFDVADAYDQVHQQLAGDAWIVGPTTMAEFGEGEPKPVATGEVFPRETWKAPGAEQGPYAIALDRKGRLHLNTGRANGDAIVIVLTTRVADAHLAELRRDGISYLFAGDDDINLPLALDRLAREFGIRRLLLEGGGGINGAFLDAGLIDEISLMVLPLADGTCGAPTLFDRPQGKVPTLKLQSVTRLDHDVLHLRYLTQ
jgi:riboflavin biosynthesis pyrimidine reductase